jgi:hypothetical protein
MKMNVFEYIQLEMARMRRSVAGVMKDMTPELFNWAPPGTANTISATFVHFINAEDGFIQDVLQGKPPLWESGGWSARTGIEKPPRMGEDWSAFKKRQTEMAPLLEYQAAVWAATDSYLASLTPTELERMVKFAGGKRTVAEMLILSASQSHQHVGEIAALKGIQGAKGMPV